MSQAEIERAEHALFRAEVAEWYGSGTATMQQIADYYGLTKQRISQIVKRVRADERKARCARGEHGSVVEYGYDRQRPDGGMVHVTILRCTDCLEEVSV